MNKSPLLSLAAAVALLAMSPPASAAGPVEAALASFQKSCRGSPKVSVDTAALKRSYNAHGWLRDDATATRTCAESIEAIAGMCAHVRSTVWSDITPYYMDRSSTTTTDLRPLESLKEIRCTLPSFYDALAAVVAKHPEWSEGDRWGNAWRIHKDVSAGYPKPEVTLGDGVLTFGYFDGTTNLSEAGTFLEHELVDIESRNAVSGGSIGEWGRFALVELYAKRELEKFNKECGAKADVDIDWAGLEKAWPGWTTWRGMCGQSVCEYMAAIGFVERVISDLADLCAKDADEKYSALKRIAHIRLTGDPRGQKVVEAWKKKPKKKLGDLAKELYPDRAFILPSFTWKGDTLTYGLWVEVVNPESAREWLSTELAKR